MDGKGAASWHGIVECSISRRSCIVGTRPSRIGTLSFRFLASSGMFFLLMCHLVNVRFIYLGNIDGTTGRSAAKQYSASCRIIATDRAARSPTWYQLSFSIALLERYAQCLAGMDSHIAYRLAFTGDLVDFSFLPFRIFFF